MERAAETGEGFWGFGSESGAFMASHKQDNSSGDPRNIEVGARTIAFYLQSDRPRMKMPANKMWW
jgi:hypothetical protein